MFSRVVEAEKEVCDQFENCLPKGFGTVVPTISFAWSIFSVVLEGMDSLRMDNKLESLAFVITNFMARTIILILIQCFLHVYWILFFMLMVIGSNALILFKLDCLSCLKSVFPSKLREMFSITLPDHKHKIVSALVSFPLCLLVSNNITKKERGELESAEDRRQAEKYLAVFSITNMMVFLPLSYMFVYLKSRILHTDPNVILSTGQMNHIYVYIALPLAAFAVIASVLLLLSPLLKDKLKTALYVLLIAASILYPTAAGMTMIEKSPTSVFIFVQNDHCITIFEGHTNTNQTFDIEQSYNGGNVTTDTGRQFSESNVEIIFETQNFDDLADTDNVYIEETADIKMKDLQSNFKSDSNRKVCFFRASDSNLFRRILFSLESQTIDDCKMEDCPFDKYSKWSEWSECNKECGGGLRSRKRKCEKCAEDKVETEGEECNTEQCYMWQWHQWTECTGLCGGGTRHRTRYCPEGKKCGDLRDGYEQEHCNTQDCPPGI